MSRSAASIPPVRLARAVPFAAILAFGISLLFPLVIQGRALYWGDVFLYFYPQQEFVQAQLRSGVIPLWNPYVLCGQPLVGNPQAWVFYPTTILLAWMPVWLYFTCNTLIHLWMAGGGTYLFLRRLTHDRTAALLGGLTYMGSGFVMARIQFPTMVMAAAWLPWMLVLTDRLIERPSVGYAALMALVISLETLAAHSQIAYLSFVTVFLYAAARLWQIRRHRERVRSVLGGAAISLVAGIAAGSVYLLPVLQLFGLSTREKLTWMQANRFVFLPEQTINFVLPAFYGHPASGDYWGEGNFWEPCVYLGAFPLVLAIYAAFRAAVRPATRFFAVMGFISLWLSMGRFGGVYWVVFYGVPGLASFHDPARFTFITTFSLACLAAFGLRALRDRKWAPRYRGGVVWLSVLNLWAFTAFINPSLRPAAFGYRPRVMALAPKLGQGRVFTALRDQVWRRYLNYDDFGPESARYAHELTDTLAPNIGIRFGVEEGSGYEPVPLKAMTEIDGLARSALERHAPNLPALMTLFNAHLLLLPEATRFPHPALRRVDARGVTAMAHRTPGPRMWIVRTAVQIEGSQRVLSALAADDFDPLAKAVVTGSPGMEPLGGAGLQPSPVRIVENGAHRVTAEADCGASPGFIIWSEAWFPGWNATVDGRVTHSVRVNHAFQGAALSPGRHYVRFDYNPSAYRVGLFLTCIALLGIAGGLAYGGMARGDIRIQARNRGFGRASGVQSFP